MRPGHVCPKARVSSRMAVTAVDSIEGPKYPTSALAMAVPRRYHKAATLCTNQEQRRCASRAGDDVEVAQCDPSWKEMFWLFIQFTSIVKVIIVK